MKPFIFAVLLLCSARAFADTDSLCTDLTRDLISQKLLIAPEAKALESAEQTLKANPNAETYLEYQNKFVEFRTASDKARDLCITKFNR